MRGARREAPELTYATPPEWARRAAREPDALLSDHAHCELGAAASAQGLVARNPSNRLLVERMIPLAIEELRHFRQVCAVLRRRGAELAPSYGNPYVEGLQRASARDRVDGLLDRLLVAALIEARSHERFELLAEHAPPEVAQLYRDLEESEAAHARLFVDLARRIAPEGEVSERLAHLERLEGELVRGLSFAPRVHSGLAPQREEAPRG